jgi:dTDP-4-amino-4,6-dideoxygalactose transaminase
MTELEAAVSRCQLKKLDSFLKMRLKNCQYLASRLNQIPAITAAPARSGVKHAYYLQAFKFDRRIAGVDRDLFVQAVRKELGGNLLDGGIWAGYLKPLYLQPMYQQKIAFGKKGFPFQGAHYSGKADYTKGICPVAERMYESELFVNDLIHESMQKKDLDDVVAAFNKVWENRKQLRD